MNKDIAQLTQAAQRENATEQHWLELIKAVFGNDPTILVSIRKIFLCRIGMGDSFSDAFD